MKHKDVAALAIPIFLVTALAGCSSPAPSPSAAETEGSVEPVTLEIGFDNPLAYTNNMPVLIAIEEGFFEEQGITATTVGFSGGSDATRALVAGSIDVQAGVGFDSVVGNANSLDVKIFYSIAQETDFVLYGSTQAGITDSDDLEGSSLAVSSFGSFSDYLARSTAGALDFADDAIEVQALGTNPALFAAIESGTVGGTWNPASLASTIKGSSILASTTSLEIPTQYSSLIATNAWLEENGDVASRVNKAIAAAIAWHQDPENRDAAIEIAVSQMQLPAPAAEAGYDGATEIYGGDGEPSVEGLSAMADAVPELGLGSTSPDVDELYTLDYLPGE